MAHGPIPDKPEGGKWSGEAADFVVGKRSGRRADQEDGLRTRAATPADAHAAIQDLHEHGVAQLDATGKRLPPPTQ